MDARSIAAQVLSLVIRDKKSLDSVLPGNLSRLDTNENRAFTQELCYGTLRWYQRLDFYLDKLLHKTLKEKDSDIKALILSGLYQLEFLRTPDHAAVAATVDASRHLGKAWASSLINAVLRRYLREKDQVNSNLDMNKTAYYSHPEWMINQIANDWPEYSVTVFNGNNEYPPLHLRINKLQINTEDYLALLTENEIPAAASNLSDCGIEILSPLDIEKLPGYEGGFFSVQDIGAQFAAPLLDVQPGQRVLDACAAPGGKTTHIFETQPRLKQLSAIDTDIKRIEMLKDNIKRLNVKADTIHADARQTPDWWDGQPYDRILLDVPCSATGVIRRHPDIKVLRTTEHVNQFLVTQSDILEQTWSMLSSGGRLVYSTCSVLSAENDLQIEKFINKHNDVDLPELDVNWGVRTRLGRQTLPGLQNTDGFYYAVLQKT